MPAFLNPAVTQAAANAFRAKHPAPVQPGGGSYYERLGQGQPLATPPDPRPAGTMPSAAGGAPSKWGMMANAFRARYPQPGTAGMPGGAPGMGAGPAGAQDAFNAYTVMRGRSPPGGRIADIAMQAAGYGAPGKYGMIANAYQARPRQAPAMPARPMMAPKPMDRY